MPSAKLTQLVALAGAQVPTDLMYIVDVSAGASGSKKSTLNDFLETITKNITDISVQWQNGDGSSTISAANHGKLKYSQSAVGSAGSFQVSEAGAAYQNLIKGPANAGDLTSNLFPFATAGDVINDTALSQLGATTSRSLNFNPYNPGTPLTAYGSYRVGVVDEGGFNTLGLFALLPSLRTIALRGTLANPTAMAAGNQLFTAGLCGQYSSTPGQFSAGVFIRAYATANWSASEGGASFEISTNKKGVIPNNAVARILINQLGCVHISPTVTGGESSTGTVTLFQVGGNSAVIDNSAITFICDNDNSGAGTVKNLVLQRKAAQTGALLQTQSATGVAQFSIIPQLGVECHFIDWVGSTNTPTISSAGSARLFVNSSGKLQISESGGSWQDVIGSIGMIVGTTAIASGSAGRLLYETSSNMLGEVTGSSADANGAMTIAPSARSSGSNAYFTITAPADTNLTASTEAIGINFNGSATRQHAAGAIATQREFIFQAPTYSFTNASTITKAATLAITGAPAAGANATITNAYALYVQAGISRFENAIIVETAPANTHIQFSYNGTTVGDFDVGNGIFTWGSGNTNQNIRTPAFLTNRIGGFGGVGVLFTSATTGFNNTSQVQIDSGAAARSSLVVNSASASTVDLAQFNLVTNQSTTVANLASFSCNSSGAPANGFGASFTFNLMSSTTSNQNAARLSVLWTNATHATRTAAIVCSVVTDAGSLTEAVRIGGASQLTVTCRATSNEGITIFSNSGAVRGDLWSDGTDLFIGALTNHTVSLVSNGTANIRFTDTTLGFLGKSPAAQQTGGAATAGATYGATEQNMLQKAYDCLRTFGLLT